MKYTLSLLALPLLLAACTDSAPQAAVTSNGDSVTAATAVSPELHTELYGSYTGPFVTVESDAGTGDMLDDTAPISLMITRITAQRVTGKSVLKGKVRPFSGTLAASGDSYRFTVNEPGDDTYDGRFDFTIVGDSLKGTWKAFDGTVPRPQKEYALRKKAFAYSPNLMLDASTGMELADYQKPDLRKETFEDDEGTVDTFTEEYYRMASDAVYKLNGSKQVLTEAQLKKLRKLDLEIIRNTIFARHGFSFSKKSVRQFFEQTDWYMPVSANVDAELTEVERQNIALLKRFEQYATDHYDTFGR
ncbi:MAG: YARHG domain-containing protein [Sphingobacteriales bacterium]|nr:MAG: YARHG domain-containing protein [Sphingobacteriales bacterium]